MMALIIIAIVLFPLMLSDLGIILTRPINPRGVPAPATGRMNVLPVPASMNTPRTIRHRLVVRPFEAPRQVSLWALFFEAWPCCFFGVSSLENAPRNDIIFYEAPAFLFLYEILGFPLFFEWIFGKWAFHATRTIYITVIKIVITVRERQIMLGAESSMGMDHNSRGFWSGFNNLIPRLVTVCTCDISYTSTTYAYTMTLSEARPLKSTWQHRICLARFCAIPNR